MFPAAVAPRSVTHDGTAGRFLRLGNPPHGHGDRHDVQNVLANLGEIYHREAFPYSTLRLGLFLSWSSRQGEGLQDERLLKVSGERKDEELNAKCRDNLVHIVFFCIYTFSVACEGQIMSCVSFVINIVSA